MNKKYLSENGEKYRYVLPLEAKWEKEKKIKCAKAFCSLAHLRG